MNEKKLRKVSEVITNGLAQDQGSDVPPEPEFPKAGRCARAEEAKPTGATRKPGRPAISSRCRSRVWSCECR